MTQPRDGWRFLPRVPSDEDGAAPTIASPTAALEGEPPERPESEDSWAEPVAVAAARAARGRRRLSVSACVSVGLHVAGLLLALAIARNSTSSEAPPEAVDVELVKQIPGAQAPRQAPAEQISRQDLPKGNGGDPSATAHPIHDQPPDPHPPAIRQAPPEPAPKRKDQASRSKAAESPATTPASPDGEIAAASPPKAAPDTKQPSTSLPFFSMPGSFRSSVLDGMGSSQSENYKGLVFGRIGRSQPFPNSAAPDHGSGQAIVAFTVDDKGDIASMSLARSSGHADLDAEAVAMVRRVSPFPPPPPGADRSFAAAIIFGQD